MPLDGGRRDLAGVAADHAVNEILVVVLVVAIHAFLRRLHFAFAEFLAFVGEVAGIAREGDDAFRTVEHHAERGAAHFVVGVPRPHFERHDLVFAVRALEHERRGGDVVYLFRVIPQEQAAHGRDPVGGVDAEAPARGIELVNALVADVAVAVFPHPVPVIGHKDAFLRIGGLDHERFFLGRALPEVPPERAGGLAGHAFADVAAPLVAHAAGHVDVADEAVLEQLDALLEPRIAAKLGAVLDDAVVFFRGLDHLEAFIDVVGHWFLDVHVLAGLARPDGGERMPVVGRGGRNRVDVLVVEDLPDIGIGFGLREVVPAEILFHAAVEQGGVDVAQPGHLGLADRAERLDVALPAAVDAHDTHVDAVIGAEYAPFRHRSGHDHRGCGGA